VKKHKICLVSSAHVSYNPRLLKEADALFEDDFEVRVVAMNMERAKTKWDERLMSSRSWRLQTVNGCPATGFGRITWLKAGLRQRLHQRYGSLQQNGFGLERCYSRYFPELCRLATSEQADLFIAHNLSALPAAAFAARHFKAKLGFDAEDFHRGEFAESDTGSALLRKLTESVEQKYIPRCDYLTAASDGIGDAYSVALGVSKPATILNVFPLSERQGHTPRQELETERKGPGLSLYWYSQVIGSDRGLEDVLEAMSLLGHGVRLHLRGAWANGYEAVFRKRVRELNVQDAVHVLSCEPPEQLVERAAQHDVGLALEPGNRPNNRLAASNKLFTYFLSGLAVAATDVPGQRRILESAPEAGFLYEVGNAQALSKSLRSWLSNSTSLHLAKQRSRQYGTLLFCWDREKHKLIHEVERAFRNKSPSRETDSVVMP